MAVKLFDEDLYSKDYKELADWIVACRNVVDKNLCRDDEDYAYSVDAFCAEWEKHYNWHNNTYAVNIPELCEFSFIISKFTDNGLEFIDKLSMFSLKSVQTIAIENACYPAKFKITI